jgi:4-amino-4-deoxy-L-arabinose transferase-like glycosyltransferase
MANRLITTTILTAISMITETQNKNIQELLFAIALAAACVYRLYHLDYYSLWADEVWSVQACELGSFKAMILHLIHRDLHPPGYQTILYFWISLFGSTEFSVRSLSALSGVAAIIVIYSIGKKHFNVLAGLLAASLLSGSFQAIYYSQEARSYSLLLLLSCISAGSFLDIFIDKSRKAVDFLVFIITGTLLVYLHYIGSVFMAAEGIIAIFLSLFAKDHRKKIIGRIFITLPFIAIMYSPWLPTMYHHATKTEFWAEKPGIHDFFNVWHFILGNSTLLATMQIAGITAVIAMFLSGKQKETTWDEKTKAATLLSLLFIPMAILFTKSYFSQSIHEDRHFIYAIPLVCLSTGYFLSRIANLPGKANHKTVFVIAAFLLISIEQLRTNTNENAHKKLLPQDLRGAVSIIKSDSEFSEKKVSIVATHGAFNHYFKINNINNSLYCCVTSSDQLSQLASIILRKKHGSFYFMEFTFSGDNSMLKSLQEKYHQVCLSELDGIRVAKFNAHTPVSTATMPACPSQ